MSAQFVVFDEAGSEIDWCDPVIEIHQLKGTGKYLVDNGFCKYEMTVPPGGRYEIREVDDD